MFALIGLILVLVGIFGLIHLLALGLAVSIILIVVGLVLIAWDRGMLSRM